MHVLMPKCDTMAQSDWLVTLKLKKLPDLQCSVCFLNLNDYQGNQIIKKHKRQILYWWPDLVSGSVEGNKGKKTFRVQPKTTQLF